MTNTAHIGWFIYIYIYIFIECVYEWYIHLLQSQNNHK